MVDCQPLDPGGITGTIPFRPGCAVFERVIFPPDPPPAREVSLERPDELRVLAALRL